MSVSPNPGYDRIIFHVDANSAFLSWSACDALQKDGNLDYRTVPSVVGGDREKRHGIVLAKSVPAKAYGIRTAEPLTDALRKCPDLLIVPADHELYRRCSRAMFDLLSEYSPLIQRFSIDEGFIDYSGSKALRGEPLEAAFEINRRVKEELGFTVNVGVSCNKLLAKMAGELKKPDMVHTLWPEEIAEKLHPLPVGELFMCGKSSAARLQSIGIKTIGDLAGMDRGLAVTLLKSHGDLLWRFANGIDDSEVDTGEDRLDKSVGHSMTISYDVTDREDAKRYLLMLTEQVCERLRKKKARALVVNVHIKTSGLFVYSRQVQLEAHSDSTDEIYRTACGIFDGLWRGEPIRQLGVHTSGLDFSGEEQLSIFETAKKESDREYDRLFDELRGRFGKDVIFRGSLAGDKK